MRPWTLVLVVLGLWAIGSGGRGVVIVLESAWMVTALGCWSSRTRIDGHLILNNDLQLKFNYAYVYNSSFSFLDCTIPVSSLDNLMNSHISPHCCLPCVDNSVLIAWIYQGPSEDCGGGLRAATQDEDVVSVACLGPIAVCSAWPQTGRPCC